MLISPSGSWDDGHWTVLPLFVTYILSFTITTHNNATFRKRKKKTFWNKNIPTHSYYWLKDKKSYIFNRPRTTQSCRHKALLSRRGLDTIEKDLQGQRPGYPCRRRLGTAISESGFVPKWLFAQMALFPNGVLSCDVLSGDIIHGDNQG